MFSYGLNLLTLIPVALGFTINSNLHVLQSSSTVDQGFFNVSHLEEYRLDDFVQDFGRSYVHGTDEWLKREQIFYSNLQTVTKLRSIPSLSWTPGITKFMDYTEQEYSSLLGYKGPSSSPPTATAFSNMSAGTLLPSEHTLDVNGIFTSLVRDQGQCGSCWAEATAATLEGVVQQDAALMSMLTSVLAPTNGGNIPAPLISTKAITDCTRNPKHCGGTGGCMGATAQLALGLVKSRGAPLSVKYAAFAGTGNACTNVAFDTMKLSIKGYTTLPRHQLATLKNALVSRNAPLAVTVDATNWNKYVSGIYTDTTFGKGEFQLNHLVTLMGYKEPSSSSQGYWLIKNSWGKEFGENGYMRIEMKANEESHCGMDTNAHNGIACEDDPSTAWVCGTCGILYDSSFPTDPYLIQ